MQGLGRLSSEAALEDLLQARLTGVVEDGLLEGYLRAPAVELQGRDVVLEPGLVVRQVSAYFLFLYTGQPGEQAPGELAPPRPAGALEA